MLEIIAIVLVVLWILGLVSSYTIWADSFMPSWSLRSW
jgi:Family of unknown function (DUF5670)